MSDDELLAAIAEDPDEQPDLPGGLTEEAAIVAQSKDPEDFDELDWHIVNPPTARESPYSECDLGSCTRPPTHYCELRSGHIFFGCPQHVKTLVDRGLAKKMQRFESDNSPWINPGASREFHPRLVVPSEVYSLKH